MAQISECTNGSGETGRLHGSDRTLVSAGRVILIRVFSVGDALPEDG